jgi:hypothetical protein
MLEQRTFTDAQHVTWLNRPGPARGVPALVILLCAFIPGQLLRLVMGLPLTVGLLITGAIAGACIAVCLMIEARWACNQTCPHCQNTRIRGYRTCSGCGYPDSWS